MTDDHGLDRLVPATPERAAEAAEHARRCTRIIRDWLPVEGREPGAGAATMDDWHDKAAWAAVAFAKYHPTPGQCYTHGPEDFGLTWRELAGGMDALREHYGWTDLDGDHRTPYSDVRGGQELPPISAALLDRIERAAALMEPVADSAAIPHDKRTKPMTKAEALNYIGWPAHARTEREAREWLNRSIRDGEYRWERINNKSGVYHLDDFNPECWDEIRAH